MSAMGKEVQLKTVVLGNGGVGKTCMLITHTTGEHPVEYIPTVFDNYSIHCSHAGIPVELGLWDTAGGEDYPRLRPLSYPQTDVFTLLFDVSRPQDLNDIENYWIPEIRHHCPTVPVVLVGSKIDLRGGNDIISADQGSDMANKIKAAKYMEISSLRSEGLKELFEEIVRVGYEYHLTVPKKRKKCLVL